MLVPGYVHARVLRLRSSRDARLTLAMGGAEFQRFDLGQCKRGDVWRVELTAAANVFLVDSTNFNAFRNGRDFRHYGGGGLMTQTPHDFVIPRAGHWYIVAHAWGLKLRLALSLGALAVALHVHHPLGRQDRMKQSDRHPLSLRPGG